jgi:cytochrome P450
MNGRPVLTLSFSFPFPKLQPQYYRQRKKSPFVFMASIDLSSMPLDGLAATFTTMNVLRLLGLCLAYKLALGLYNISPLHPLFRFPGPRLAAMSFIYELYYDLILVGRYSHEIKRMHERYGPIVRINPEELHCNDPDFADEIAPASTARVRDRHKHFLKSFAGPAKVATAVTQEHELHRRRKSAVSRFFSRAQILRLEPEILAMAQKMCDKILMCAGEGPVEMIHAFSCFAADTISQYAYGAPFGFLDQDRWLPNLKPALESISGTVYLFRFVPLLRHSVAFAPYLGKFMGVNIAQLMKYMHETIPNLVTKAKKDPAKGRIFTELLNSSLPKEEKTLYRLSGEGFSLIAAGSESPANTLVVITYFLLTRPEITACLAEDLKGIDPGNLSWCELEQHSYLNGVIYEGLRLSYGMSSRLAMVPRNENLHYQNGGYQYFIPRGTPIGMSSSIMHHDENIFPNSYEFMPERWIDSHGQKNKALEKYIACFGRGTRQCLGMNLALCELYLVVAAMILRSIPRMEIYDTSWDDIAYDHDMLTPQPKKGARGLRVTITEIAMKGKAG